MSMDPQLKYRMALQKLLDFLSLGSSMRAQLGGGGRPADRTEMSVQIKIDRLMRQAKKEMSKDEYELLLEWKNKELSAEWSLFG